MYRVWRRELAGPGPEEVQQTGENCFCVFLFSSSFVLPRWSFARRFLHHSQIRGHPWNSMKSRKKKRSLYIATPFCVEDDDEWPSYICNRETSIR